MFHLLHLYLHSRPAGQSAMVPSRRMPTAVPAGWCQQRADGGRRSGDGESIRQIERQYHVPVLPSETIAALQPGPGKRFLDATLGGGGHSERLLEAGAEVIGLDRDGMALEFARCRLASFDQRFEARQGAFGDLIHHSRDRAPFDGILLDIGVSSAQLDRAERGFSFRLNGPLDMRMDPERGISAAELLAEVDESELARILFEYGEERHSRRIAKAIVRVRNDAPISSTAQLAEIIAAAAPGRPGPVHPATRSFQALRIAVNGELEQLESALNSAADLLKPGGRLAVITFHSLEDRLVKRFFVATSKAEIDQPNWPAPRPNPELIYRKLTRKAITASESELARNPRARSAKLRAVEKLANSQVDH